MAQSDGDALSGIPVLIVGAGPVGLSAAILLARLGIRSLVIERHPSTTDHPKHAVSLRPWDVEAQLRANALPSGAFRFIWVETLAGREIGRVEPPRRDVPGPFSPTYVCMAAQDAFEGALRDHALTYPQIDLRFSTELTAFVQDASSVATTLRQSAGAFPCSTPKHQRQLHAQHYTRSWPKVQYKNKQNEPDRRYRTTNSTKKNAQQAEGHRA